VAQGGRKTPPNNIYPFINHSFSDSTVVTDTTTASESQPIILVEPATPLPQGIDVQEII